MYTGEFAPNLRRDHEDRLRRAHHSRRRSRARAIAELDLPIAGDGRHEHGRA